MKKLFFLILVFLCSGTPQQSYAISFPKKDAMITPLIVFDSGSIPMLGGMTGQQILSAIISAKDYINKLEAQLAFALDFPTSARELIRAHVPTIAPLADLNALGVTLFTEVRADIVQPNIQSPETVAAVVEKEIMVTDETSGQCVQLEGAERDKFIQEHAITSMATALYYDTVLKGLTTTIADLEQSYSGEVGGDSDADKLGAMQANFKYMDAWYQLLTLQEQIRSERLLIKTTQAMASGEPMTSAVMGETK